MQQYVRHPYLIHRKKFDLRIYVCVTSVDPLRVYMYEEGRCRVLDTQAVMSKLTACVCVYRASKVQHQAIQPS